MSTTTNPPSSAASQGLAIVTGASSGIGRELALEAARHRYDLLLAADRPLDAEPGSGNAS